MFKTRNAAVDFRLKTLSTAYCKIFFLRLALLLRVELTISAIT